MTSNPERDLATLRSLVFGLLRECPFGGNPEDCIAHELRKMDARDHWDWVMGQSQEELNAVYERHLACAAGKRVTHEARDPELSGSHGSDDA